MRLQSRLHCCSFPVHLRILALDCRGMHGTHRRGLEERGSSRVPRSGRSGTCALCSGSRWSDSCRYPNIVSDYKLSRGFGRYLRPTRLYRRCTSSDVSSDCGKVFCVYISSSSLASRPTMCNTAKRPPGCLLSQPLRRRTLPSLMTRTSPAAMRPSMARGLRIRSRSMMLQ